MPNLTTLCKERFCIYDVSIRIAYNKIYLSNNIESGVRKIQVLAARSSLISFDKTYYAHVFNPATVRRSIVLNSVSPRLILRLIYTKIFLVVHFRGLRESH